MEKFLKPGVGFQCDQIGIDRDSGAKCRLAFDRLLETVKTGAHLLGQAIVAAQVVQQKRVIGDLL